jgi:hypothetical protein
MSEFNFEGQVAGSSVEYFPEGAIGEPTSNELMPFDPDSSEADALKGALSFLFALISSYDEMMEMAATETDVAA